MYVVSRLLARRIEGCLKSANQIHIQSQTQHFSYFHKSTAKMSSSGDEVVWSFGYGSNMDVKAVEAKKHVKIVDSVCAILPGWKLSFSLPGIPYAEPAYANIEADPAGEVHGVAFCMTKASGEELDRTESGYDKKDVTLHAYDGRKLDGFVYVSKPGAKKSAPPPSSRYVGVLIKGGKAAGLKQEYLDNLAKVPTYTSPPEALKWRKELPKPEDLPMITVEELAKHKKRDDKDHPPRLAFFGYVLEAASWFGEHLGRDITTRMLNQFHGIPMNDNDDQGKPPYPILTDLTEDETEYVARWGDHYMSKVDGKVIGFLKEFQEQQKSGKSDWKLPPKL